jgi:hypothetical protein
VYLLPADPKIVRRQFPMIDRRSAADLVFDDTAAVCVCETATVLVERVLATHQVAIGGKVMLPDGVVTKPGGPALSRDKGQSP